MSLIGIDTRTLGPPRSYQRRASETPPRQWVVLVLLGLALCWLSACAAVVEMPGDKVFASAWGRAEATHGCAIDQTGGTAPDADAAPAELWVEGEDCIRVRGGWLSPGIAGLLEAGVTFFVTWLTMGAG